MAFAFVNFAVSAQVGDDGEVTAATINVAGKCWKVLVIGLGTISFVVLLTLLASVAVHMCLERAWSREALVANLALVLLLAARRDLGAELTHHGRRRGW